MITEYFDLPKYENINYLSPVWGFGNFTNDIKNNVECKVDVNVVENKFALWDKAIEMGLFENTGKDKKGNVVNEERYYMHLKAVALLKDKSVFCYAHFKFNGKPLKTRWTQDIILSDNDDLIIYAAANQTGKSITLDIDAATDFSIDHGKGFVGILVSNSRDQSEYQMDRIKELLKTGKIDYKEESTTEAKTGKKDNAKIITYTFYEDDKVTPKYSNRIVCCPPTSSALGYPADKLWLDEFDFWEDIDQNWFINQIALPRTFETKGKIRIFSNPNGKDRYLNTLWNEVDENGNHVWHRYQFNYWDKPGCTQEFFTKKTRNMTQHQIASTMLAVFSQSAGAFLSYKEIIDSIDPELCAKGDSAGIGTETVWFLDLGVVHDQSVLVGGFVTENPEYKDIPIINVFWVHKYPVGFPLHRVFGTQKMKEIISADGEISYVKDDDYDDGWNDYVSNNPSVREVLTEYSEEYNGKKEFPLFGMDVTGNSGAKPLIETIGIDPVDITFSGKSKWGMYQRLEYYFKQRFIKRCKDRDENTINIKDGTYQFSKLVVKKGTNTSYRQIHHENENDYDDVPDSFAGLIKLIENPELPTLRYAIINNKEIRKNDELDQLNKNKQEETQDKTEIIDSHKDKVNKELEGQYIPSYMTRDDMKSFVSRKIGW